MGRVPQIALYFKHQIPRLSSKTCFAFEYMILLRSRGENLYRNIGRSITQIKPIICAPDISRLAEEYADGQLFMPVGVHETPK